MNNEQILALRAMRAEGVDLVAVYSSFVILQDTRDTPPPSMLDDSQWHLSDARAGGHLAAAGFYSSPGDDFWIQEFAGAGWLDLYTLKRTADSKPAPGERWQHVRVYRLTESGKAAADMLLGPLPA